MQAGLTATLGMFSALMVNVANVVGCYVSKEANRVVEPDDSVRLAVRSSRVHVWPRGSVSGVSLSCGVTS